MRLDLFLKTSRLVKRRTLARQLCEVGRVLVNGTAAKPAKEIRQGDIITLSFSTRIVEIEMIGVPASPGKRVSSEELYIIKSERRIDKEQDR